MTERPAAELPVPRLAFGMSAGQRPWLGPLGLLLEELGYDEMWSNDVPGASGLDTLSAVAATTTRLRLAVGVMALSDAGAAGIAAQVAASGLPLNRLTVGVGSGAGRSLAAVRSGVAELRERLPRHDLGLAAVGPRMAELGGEIADVVLLNWIGPRLAVERRRVVEAAASSAGRARPRLAAYVRVAVGPGAHQRLAIEQARYAGHGGSYAKVIAEQEGRGESPVGVAAEAPGDAPAALAAYRSVLDTVVVRGLPARDDLESWLAIARAAHPRFATGAGGPV